MKNYHLTYRYFEKQKRLQRKEKIKKVGQFFLVIIILLVVMAIGGLTFPF